MCFIEIGTVFTVKLPLQIDWAYYQLSEKKDPLQVMKGLQILLVEDNELNMAITEYMMTEQGAVVTEAWNGKEAQISMKAVSQAHLM